MTQHQTQTIGIIGGTGGMGRLFEAYFKRCGHTVLIAGRKTELSYAALVRQSNVVILSAPQEASIPIIKDIGPLMTSDQLLMDFCSMKEDIVGAMVANSKAQVIGTHPLFGPFTASLANQNIIICPARGVDWIDWCRTTLSAEGAVVTAMKPADHDRSMAVVQGLTHLITVCIGRTLLKLDIKPQDALQYSTPLFRLNLDLVGRLFAQDLHLFSSLITKNSNFPEVLQVFMEAMNESKAALFESDDNRHIDFLASIRNFMGEFCEQALAESNQFIDALYAEEQKKREK